jgi:hypothetical protein
MVKRLPEDVIADLHVKWLRASDIAARCSLVWGVGPSKAREIAARLLFCGGAKRFEIKPYAWYTIKAVPPPHDEVMRARAEWRSVSYAWRRKHLIGQLLSPGDQVHAHILGALASQGDEAAMEAFNRLRRAARTGKPLVRRGRGNALDMFCYGEAGARRLEHAEK